jgi:transcription elongation factor Elf1
MVHYRREQMKPALAVTLRCTQCDSSRTEVIGMSMNLKTTFVRCNACGARSEVPAREPREASAAR